MSSWASASKAQELTADNSLDEVLAAVQKRGAPNVVVTSSPSTSNIDSLYVSGTLPGQGGRYEVKVKLDAETYDIHTFWVKAGGRKHRLPRSDKTAYRQLDLTTLRIEDNSSRDLNLQENQRRRVWEDLLVSVEYGPYLKSYECRSGLPELIRGRDRLHVRVSRNRDMFVSNRKFGDDTLNHMCKEKLFDVPVPTPQPPEDDQ